MKKERTKQRTAQRGNHRGNAKIGEEKNLLDKRKAAKLLGISEPTLTKYIRAGMIETKRVPNSTKEYITKQTLIKFLES